MLLYFGKRYVYFGYRYLYAYKFKKLFGWWMHKQEVINKYIWILVYSDDGKRWIFSHVYSKH